MQVVQQGQKRKQRKGEKNKKENELVSYYCTERNTCRVQIPNSVMRIETERG